MVANVMSDRSCDKQFSLATTARNFVVFDPGLPLGRYSRRTGWTGTFESQSVEHLFHMARVCFYPKLWGTPSRRSVEDLELLVKIRCFSDHLRLTLIPLFELSDQPLSVFPRSLDSDIITMDWGADSPRLFGVQARARLSPAQANLLPEASKLAFPVLSSVTGAIQALSQHPPKDRCRLCASPSHRSTLFARQSPRALFPSGCLTLPPK